MLDTGLILNNMWYTKTRTYMSSSKVKKYYLSQDLYTAEEICGRSKCFCVASSMALFKDHRETCGVNPQIITAVKNIRKNTRCMCARWMRAQCISVNAPKNFRPSACIIASAYAICLKFRGANIPHCVAYNG